MRGKTVCGNHDFYSFYTGDAAYGKDVYTVSMKLSKATDRKAHKNNPTTTAYEYNTGSTAINGAVITINGRYPESGRALNTLSTSLVHVMLGNGVALFEGMSVELATDDELLIEPHESYAFEGNMTILYVATPAWTAEQAEHISVN
jgi:hypothetical protein